MFMLSNLIMLKLNLRPGLCLAYAKFLGLSQPGYAYRVYAHKKQSVGQFDDQTRLRSMEI